MSNIPHQNKVTWIADTSGVYRCDAISRVKVSDTIHIKAIPSKAFGRDWHEVYAECTGNVIPMCDEHKIVLDDNGRCPRCQP